MAPVADCEIGRDETHVWVRARMMLLDFHLHVDDLDRILAGYYAIPGMA